MDVLVRIMVAGAERPPVGAPILVQAQDVSLADVPSAVLASGSGAVRNGTGMLLDSVGFSVDCPSGACALWVHVDSDRDGQISHGDFITMESYPIPVSGEREYEASVVVRPV
jgi:hypothetical protein